MKTGIKFRLVALATFCVGVAAAWFFQGPPDIPARFQILAPPVPKPNTIDAVPNHCGLLVVTIDSELNLKLNSEEIGTARDPGPLKAKLTGIFRHRTDSRVYDEDMEHDNGLPVEKRIMKTVIIKGSRSLPYSEILRLIDAVKETGAQPIALQLDELPS